MSKILALFASLWHLIENKTVFVGLVTAASSVGAYYGLNVPVSIIITAATAIMAGLGIAGWQSTAATAQETQIKLHLLGISGTSKESVHDSYLTVMGRSKAKRTPQVGSARLTVLFIVAAIGIGTITSAVLVVSDAGCAATTQGGTCELNAIEQAVPTDGFPIVVDIINAVTDGGAALPVLIAEIVKDFGPATAKCATAFVDTLLSTYLASAGSGAAPTVAMVGTHMITDRTLARTGLDALHVEMSKYGWPLAAAR